MVMECMKCFIKKDFETWMREGRYYLSEVWDPKTERHERTWNGKQLDTICVECWEKFKDKDFLIYCKVLFYKGKDYKGKESKRIRNTNNCIHPKIEGKERDEIRKEWLITQEPRLRREFEESVENSDKVWKIVGVVLLVAIGLVAIWYWLKGKKEHEKQEDND